MKILFDTNVMLDALLRRNPHLEMSARLINRVENGQIDGYLSAHSITTLDYLVGKYQDRGRSREVVKNLLTLFQIAEINHATLNLALDLPFLDFGDAVLYQAGVGVGIDAVVTRNGRDFKGATLPIYSPEELYGLLRRKEIDNG